MLRITRLSALTASALILLCASPALAATTASGSAISANWSGYVAQSGTFSGVGASWRVPSPSLTSATSWISTDATWVGIGGEATHDLIQAGTQATIQSGGITYQAWYEMLPGGQHIIPLAIRGGDAVSVSLIETTPGSWQLSFTDETTGASYTKDLAYQSSHSSAEWIEEMPAAEAGNSLSLLPLDDFGTVQFTDGFAVDNGARVTIAGAGAQQLSMGSRRTLLAQTSSLSGDSFSVTRTNAPSADFAAAEEPTQVSPGQVVISHWGSRRSLLGGGRRIVIKVHGW